MSGTPPRKTLLSTRAKRAIELLARGVVRESIRCTVEGIVSGAPPAGDRGVAGGGVGGGVPLVLEGQGRGDFVECGKVAAIVFMAALRRRGLTNAGIAARADVSPEAVDLFERTGRVRVATLRRMWLAGELVRDYSADELDSMEIASVPLYLVAGGAA